ncbi:MAG: HEPN domain-containing protein [Thermodesulfobacteriota bacterium]
MNQEAQAFWERALSALATARRNVTEDPDAAASRAYYGAFYAVSAWFAGQERYFTKHSAVLSAVHKDLVHPGTWPEEIGVDYNFLVRTRNKGDYGRLARVDLEEALASLAAAVRIIEAVHKLAPEDFPLLPDWSQA